jgi:hypothetical protein
MLFNKQLFIISFFITINTVAFSQSISSSLVASGGDFYESSEGSLQFSIGENSVTTFSSTNSIITQGFEQSEIIINSISNPLASSQINIYPNPSSDRVIISGLPICEIDEIILSDITGRSQNLIMNENESSIELNVSALTDGTYFFQIILKNSDELHTYKIIKTTHH